MDNRLAVLWLRAAVLEARSASSFIATPPKEAPHALTSDEPEDSESPQQPATSAS